MTKGFTIEEHEARMRALLKPKPDESQKSQVLRSLLDKVKAKKGPR